MKIKKKKETSTLKKTLIVVASLLLVGSMTYLVYGLVAHKNSQKNDTPPNSIDYTPPTDEQKAAGDRQKEETTKEPRDEITGDNRAINVTFTALNQVEGQVQIRTLIDAVSSDGNCTLTLTKSGTTVTKQSGIQAGPNTSTCMGFNIPVSELSPGTWTVSANVVIGTQKGNATKDFTVN